MRFLFLKLLRQLLIADKYPPPPPTMLTFLAEKSATWQQWACWVLGMHLGIINTCLEGPGISR